MLDRAQERCKQEMAANPPEPTSTSTASSAATGVSAAGAAGTSPYEYKYFYGLCISINYNIARLCELTHELAKAEALYKEIIKQTPYYVDCTLPGRTHFKNTHSGCRLTIAH